MSIIDTVQEAPVSPKEDTNPSVSEEKHASPSKELNCLLTIPEFIKSLKEFKTDSKNDENTQKNSKEFENYVKNKVVSILGFREVNKKNKLYKQMLDNIRDKIKMDGCIKNIYHNVPVEKIIVFQPYGSQAPPDMILMDITKDFVYFQPLEAKNGKKAATWNNNYPVNHWIYIFSGKNGVTYFHGKNMVTNEEKELFEQYKIAKKAVTEEFNKKLVNMKSTWTLVNYFKFEHTSEVDYKKDEDVCSQRENDVKDLLDIFVSMNIDGS